LIAAVSVGAFVCLAQFVFHRATDLSIEPFFDEMWRIDGIFSPGGIRRVLDNAAPLSPAWLYGSRIVGWVSESFTVLRSSNLLLAALGAALCSLAISNERRDGAHHVRACVVGVAVLSTSLVFNVSAYFNNYGWEIFVVGVVLMLGLRESACLHHVALVPVALIAGLTLQGGLPFVASYLLVRFLASWSRTDMWTARMVAAMPVVALGAGSVVNLAWANGVQQADRRGDLTSFWGAEAFRIDHLGSSLRLLYRTAGEGFTPQWMDTAGATRHYAVLLVGVAALGGALKFRAGILRIVAATALAIPILAGASVVTAGPFAVNRLTVAGFVPLLCIAFDSVVIFVERALSRVRTHRVVQLIVVGSLLIALATWGTLNTRTANDSPAVFARGLLEDVRQVDLQTTSVTGEEPGARLWVVYHPMSHWYVRHALRTSGSPDRIVHETWDSQDLYTLTRLRRLTGKFEAVVCVVPYEVGPEGSARACPMSEKFALVETVRLTRAEFRTFVHLDN
jgi:hypothetical protein